MCDGKEKGKSIGQNSALESSKELYVWNKGAGVMVHDCS